MNLEYSIDMIKLRARFNKEFLNKFFSHPVFAISPNIKAWIDKDVRGFRYNYSVSDSSGASLYIGCMHNSEDMRSDSTWVYVEYNPNKFDVQDAVVPGQVRGLLRHMAICGEVVFVHVAIDVYEGIEGFIVDKRYKSSYRLFVTRKGRSYYVGKSGKNGFMRVYDKAKEQGVDFAWTRIEYVVRFDCSVDSISAPDVSKFPCVYRIKPDVVNPVVRCLILGIKEGVILLSDLTRTYRQKVKGACELVAIDPNRVYELVCGILEEMRGLS